MSRNADLERLLKTLKKLKGGDPESNHLEADTALLDFINDEEVRVAFEEINRWYS